MGDDCPKENTGALTDLRDPDTPSYEPEAKKSKIETIEIDNDDSDGRQEQLSALTPSRKTRTPKMSKEEREAMMQKRLELRKQKDEEKRQREEERLRAKEEKERLLEEKRLEREKKEKEREEKKREEEARKAELEKVKEEKREAKRREEEEKQKKKDELLLKKKEEEEAKKKEEEAEAEKKKRASARFIGFFKKVEKEAAPPEKVEKDQQELWYRAFQVKPGMTVAPVLRRSPLNMEQDILTQQPDVSKTTYLTSDGVKKRTLNPASQIELKAKLFQFHDNYRPPYYGTWRKTDPSISSRRPNKATSHVIDYAVESDAEWEDEPSDAEECKSDEEDPDVEEVDSDAGEFYVEHGYLSDGEGQDEDCDPEDRDAEGRAERLAARASEWKRNVLNKPKVLIPVCIGPSFTPLPQLLAAPAVIIP